MRQQPLSSAVTLLLAVPALAGGTVALDLSSSHNGGSVAPGAIIDWTVTATVSSGDNLGLAGVVLDLIQAPANPRLIEIAQADAVPSGMENFSVPAGISNFGEAGAPTGYVGVQRGVPGGKNLIQIGGSQNTLGVPGVAIGTNVNVISGVGQIGPQVIASGSFAAPSAPGVYAYSLTNAVANVIDQINSPPGFSSVSAATVNISAGTIQFGVQNNCPADLDHDNAIDLGDLTILLSNFGIMGGATPEQGDIDDDDAVDLSDLTILLSQFGAACP
jgi:hypothetical protein